MESLVQGNISAKVACVTVLVDSYLSFCLYNYTCVFVSTLGSKRVDGILLQVCTCIEELSFDIDSECHYLELGSLTPYQNRCKCPGLLSCLATASCATSWLIEIVTLQTQQ